MSGAPIGNQNAVKAKRWQQAIDRALAKRCKGDAIAALDDLAEKFLSAVENGETNYVSGFKEFGDRLDGKAHQSITADVDANVTVQVVRFDNSQAT